MGQGERKMSVRTYEEINRELMRAKVNRVASEAKYLYAKKREEELEAEMHNLYDEEFAEAEEKNLV